MKKDLDWIYDYEQDLIDKDEERNTLFEYIDKMARIDWEMPQSITTLRPDIRTIRDSTPAEAVENASITLSNQKPVWTVLPFGSDPKEYERANNIEYIIDCNFNKSNKRGTGTVLFDKARSSILYNIIATRTDDLASILPKNKKLWTPMQRNAWAGGRFIHRAFNPKGIHYDISDMGLQAVLNCRVVRAMELMKYWEVFSHDNQVKKAINQMKEYMNERKSKDSSFNARAVWFAYYDFIDHNQIAKHGHFCELEDYDTNIDVRNPDDIVFVDSENEQGFINWSIRVGGNRIEENPKYQLNPMLAQLYYSNVWETVNIIQSIVLSKPISEIDRAKEAQFTADGQRLPEEDGVLLGRRDDRVDRLQYPMQDPFTMQVVDRLLQSIVRNTNASALGDINTAKGTPFATLNAVLQVIMGKLEIQRRDMGLSCVDDAINALKWVEHNKEPMLVYRGNESTVNGKTYSVGSQVVITADDFDAYEIEIDCDIRPKTPTDFQQQVLTAIQLHDKSPLPWKELLQGLGFKNTDLLKQQRISEDFDDATIDAQLQSILRRAEMKDQMAMQQAQPPAPSQGKEAMTAMPNAGGGLSEAAFGALGNTGQAFNPAAGGMSTSNMMPNLTRETVSGVDNQGNPVR